MASSRKILVEKYIGYKFMVYEITIGNYFGEIRIPFADYKGSGYDQNMLSEVANHKRKARELGVDVEDTMMLISLKLE